MQREIGSEFWDIPAQKNNINLFPEGTGYFLSGRIALKFILDDILKARKVTSAALPSWCCDSMILPFLEKGIEIKFYTVSLDTCGLMQNFIEAERCDIVLVMDYFGYRSELSADGFKGVVIRDLTHSVFLNQYNDADYCFGSLRKWTGFYTGGFAYKKDGHFCLPYPIQTNESYIALRKQAMSEKKAYVSDESDSKQYLNKFLEAEALLEQALVSAAAEEDIKNIENLDIAFIKEQRVKNAAYLLNHFSDIAVFPELTQRDCPLFVPILVPNGKRNELRKYLIENNIYCPVHWPIPEHYNITDITRQIYDNELSLVCDQRYNTEDMQFIVKTINKFWRK